MLIPDDTPLWPGSSLMNTINVQLYKVILDNPCNVLTHLRWALSFQEHSLYVFSSQNYPPVCTHLPGWQPSSLYFHRPWMSTPVCPHLQYPPRGGGCNIESLVPTALTSLVSEGIKRSSWVGKKHRGGCHPERWVHRGGSFWEGRTMKESSYPAHQV